jgi:hypothetical protein
MSRIRGAILKCYANLSPLTRHTNPHDRVIMTELDAKKEISLLNRSAL